MEVHFLSIFIKSRVQMYLYAVVFIGLFFNTLKVSGQSNGLAFASHETFQDARTGIDLSPGTTLCFNRNFDLSFDLSFLPNQPTYFGYIFRIIDNRDKNIDLLYDLGSPKSQHFKFVIGDSPSNLTFGIDSASLFKKWNKITVKFNYQDKTLSYFVGSSAKYTHKIDITKGSCFKILFGTNEYGNFKTTDIPPMKIRNIRITEDDEVKYDWPLDEEEGQIARELIAEKNASVKNPVWIKKMHYQWKLLKNMVLNGPVSSTFDAKSGVVHITGLDSLFEYNTNTNQFTSIKYNSGTLNLLRGNQSIYNGKENKLYNIYVDQAIVASFNFKTQSWDSNFKVPSPITNNWQYNKFYSPSDSSIYILGGYGHYTYTNEIKRYHIPTKSWSTIKATGNFFTPRYLAALGKAGNGAYIIGGYGSSSGQQIINPKNISDLLYFDVKKKSFKKIYELKLTDGDLVLANSLIVNEKDRYFYGLTFPKHKFNSSLQLIKGSLDSPSFHAVGSSIPYKFHDINSFSDLYYNHSSERFIAVTLFLNERNQTEVSIYSLASPPLPAKTVSFAKANKYNQLYLILFFGALVALSGLFIFWKKRKTKIARLEALLSNEHKPVNAVPVQSDNKNGVHYDDITSLSHLMDFPKSERLSEADSIIEIKNSIFLFGDLQLFDSEGHDITKYFTPLIKELFLVILLYTIRWERGISSEKLKELLWFDKSAESARNNRSVNIAKLKTLLDKLQNCQISKETGYWKINIDYQQLDIDYHNYLKIVKDKRKLNKEKIRELAEIIQRGSFLSNLDYEWLDIFKSEISNEVIDTYLHFANSIEISEDPEFLIKIASYIFYFDSVNEEAMMLKCKALAFLGKHSLAKTTFENFNKEYKVIYGEEFGKNFHAILE